MNKFIAALIASAFAIGVQAQTTAPAVPKEATTASADAGKTEAGKPAKSSKSSKSTKSSKSSKSGKSSKSHKSTTDKAAKPAA